MNEIKNSGLVMYISIPIKKAEESFIIEKALQDIGIKVNNPVKIEEANFSKELVPPKVYAECVKMMDESQFGVILLDYFGNDCACELGYMYSTKKPMFGVFINKLPGDYEHIKDLKCYEHSLMEKKFESVDELTIFLKEKYNLGNKFGN